MAARNRALAHVKRVFCITTVVGPTVMLWGKMASSHDSERER
jgi:hypothetical protein